MAVLPACTHMTKGLHALIQPTPATLQPGFIQIPFQSQLIPTIFKSKPCLITLSLSPTPAALWPSLPSGSGSPSLLQSFCRPNQCATLWLQATPAVFALLCPLGHPDAHKITSLIFGGDGVQQTLGEKPFGVVKKWWKTVFHHAKNHPTCFSPRANYDQNGFSPFFHHFFTVFSPFFHHFFTVVFTVVFHRGFHRVFTGPLTDIFHRRFPSESSPGASPSLSQALIGPLEVLPLGLGQPLASVPGPWPGDHMFPGPCTLILPRLYCAPFQGIGLQGSVD